MSETKHYFKLPETTGLIIEFEGTLEDAKKIVNVIETAADGKPKRFAVLGSKLKVFYKPSEWEVIET
jgi:hypothetical protein